MIKQTAAADVFAKTHLTASQVPSSVPVVPPTSFLSLAICRIFSYPWLYGPELEEENKPRVNLNTLIPSHLWPVTRMTTTKAKSCD